MFQYSVIVNGQKHYVTSYLSAINNTYVRLRTGVSVNKTLQVDGLTAYVFPISALEMTIPTGSQNSFRGPSSNGTWIAQRLAKVNSENLISSISLGITNVKQGINYHLKVTLLKSSDNLMRYLSNNRVGRNYYFFIPQLIPPTSISTMLQNPTNFIIQIPPGGGGDIGGTVYLSERDNTVADIYIWHIGTTLSVSSFTSGSSGWSSSLNVAVGTNNPFHNWWLESTSISTSENSQHDVVTATGSAYFYGVFPLGPYDLWYAFPSVQVQVYSVDIMAATIQNLVLVSGVGIPPPIPWSDSTIFNGQFYGYQYSVQYIV